MNDAAAWVRGEGEEACRHTGLRWLAEEWRCWVEITNKPVDVDEFETAGRKDKVEITGSCNRIRERKESKGTKTKLVRFPNYLDSLPEYNT